MKGKALVAFQFLLLALLAISENHHRNSIVLDALALLFLFTAALLLVKGFRDLGDALTPLPESKAGASLVTTGIYGKVRHPIYSALFLFALGTVLWKQSRESLLFSVLLVVLLLYKSRYEDAILRLKFPEAESYQRNTPAFLPSWKLGRS